MIDENKVIKKEEAKEYPLIPKNLYQVEILDINEVDAKGKYAEPGEKVYVFEYVLLNGVKKVVGDDGVEVEQSLRGRRLWDNFIPTELYIGKKNGKNNLYKVVEAVLGRAITPAEEEHFEVGKVLNSFIGKQLKVYVIHKKSTSDASVIFTNVGDWLPIEKEEISLTAKEKEAFVKKDGVDTNPIPPSERTVDNTAPFENESHPELLLPKDDHQKPSGGDEPNPLMDM